MSKPEGDEFEVTIGGKVHPFVDEMNISEFIAEHIWELKVGETIDIKVRKTGENP